MMYTTFLSIIKCVSPLMIVLQTQGTSVNFVVKRSRIFGSLDTGDLGNLWLKPCPGTEELCHLLISENKA